MVRGAGSLSLLMRFAAILVAGSLQKCTAQWYYSAVITVPRNGQHLPSRVARCCWCKSLGAFSPLINLLLHLSRNQLHVVAPVLPRFRLYYDSFLVGLNSKFHAVLSHHPLSSCGEYRFFFFFFQKHWFTVLRSLSSCPPCPFFILHCVLLFHFPFRIEDALVFCRFTSERRHRPSRAPVNLPTFIYATIHPNTFGKQRYEGNSRISSFAAIYDGFLTGLAVGDRETISQEVAPSSR